MAKTTNAVALIDEFKAVAIIGSDQNALTKMIEENIGADMTAFDLPRVKVPAGGGSFWEVMTLAGVKPAESIEGVIMARTDGKKYWEKGVDEAAGEKTPPDCRSEDRVHGYGNPGGLCRDCKLNEFESAKKGSGKACRDFTDLYILQKESVLPTVIQVPPTSLKNLKQYGVNLMNFGCSIHDVVTRFSLASEMKSGSKTAIIQFESVSPVPEEMKPFIKGYSASVKALVQESIDNARKMQDTQPESDTAAAAAEDGQAPFQS